MTATEHDLRQIWSWNAKLPAAINGLVHEIIAAKAFEQPESIAVRAWDGTWTYKEVDHASTRLAQLLCSKGHVDGGSAAPIILCFEKSRWTCIAMLGTMKAGGISVMLDVSQPVNRLRSIVRQTRASLILCSPSTKPIASDLDDSAEVLEINGEGLPEATEAWLPDISPDQTLFVTYTSGSTGTPKGACISHANVCSAVHYQGAKLGFSRQSIVLDFAPYSFDVAWSNMLQTLCAGGTLCIPSTNDMLTDLASCIDQYRVTLINVTPTILRTLDRHPISLTDVLLSGEAADVQLLTRWASQVRLLNTYGPAECTFKSAFAEVPADPDAEPTRIGYGHGAVLWIVDADDASKLAAIGQMGELWLEGPLVGQGYLNDVEMTDSAFVHDPPWLVNGQAGQAGREGRLYRTGDLACRSPDGSITFGGRRDRQVKISGVRVELGDVEYHLRRCIQCAFNEEVAVEAIVPCDSESLILVAFFTCERPAALEESLAQALPRYMMPTACVHVSGQLPRTATGKIDRRRLRATYSQHTFAELAATMPQQMAQQPPQASMEWQLQRLWATVLGLPAMCVGSCDSFFHLGGDSVRAMRLVGVAREQGLIFTVAEVFENPKLSDLAAIVRQSRAAERNEAIPAFSLLRGLDPEHAIQETCTACGVHASLIEDIFPCTPLQEGLMALTALKPGDYVSTRSYELWHDVDIDRFRGAWEQVVAVVPILRTRIVAVERQLMQVVLREKPRWNSSADSNVSSLRNAIALGTPLAYVMLDPKHNGRHKFTMIMHHAIVDGWSRSVVLEMLHRAYAGDALQQSPPFQRFIKHVMSSRDVEAETAWKNKFESITAPIFPALPTRDYRPRATAVVEHAIERLDWPVTDVTPSSLVQVALALVLEQYTDSADVVFGSTVSGRDVPVAGIELMTGPTIATVPQRILVDENETVGELLARVQVQNIEMKAFEHIGLSRIQQLSADAEQACNFQTLLVVYPNIGIMENSAHTVADATPDALDSGYVSEDSEEQAKGKGVLHMNESTGTLGEVVDAGANTYGLMIACQLRDAGVEITVSFDPILIDGDSVERMLEQLETVLRQLCQQHGWHKKTSDINAITEQDLESVRKWNRWAPESVPGVVHTILSDVARGRPDALAIHAWDGDLTYDQLDSLSTRLAKHLISSNDMRADEVVPICHEKSMWTSVAILGVMKAGAATLVLDVTQPEQRLQSIIEQVRPKVILTAAVNADLANSISANAQVMEIKSFLQPAECHDLPIVQPEHALFLVFTSGSSGQPKGIVIDHQNFSSALVHQTAHLGFTKDTRTFDFASYAFDASYYNLFHTLYAGGCLCVPSEDDRHNDLSGSILRLGATFANLTPKVAELLDKDALGQLQMLELSGEATNAAVVARLRQHTKVRFAYGPAECSVMSTVSSEQASVGTIGRGIGTCCWIVNPRNASALTPIGGIGELWLEGPLVGRKYFNDSDRTAAAFVTHPAWLSRACGRSRRAYRTGDLVRYNADGNLMFIGRRDGQTKIRGQRVELDEVAYHVQQYLIEHDAGVKVFAEVGVSPSYSNSQLVAFVVLTKADSRTSQDLANAIEVLSKDIPGRMSTKVSPYMIPSLFVPLSTVPLTTTGKVDRQHLRRMIETLQPGPFNPLKSSEVPLTDMERRLSSIWAKILKIDESCICRKTSFWNIGGDSITAMSLLVAIRKEYDVELKMPMLTRKDTTLEQLSTRIADLRHGEQDSKKSKVDIRADLAEISKRLAKAASAGSDAMLPLRTGRTYTAFLTGATGFLGTQILRELLSCRRFRKVVVLVRASDENHGLERVRSAAEAGGWWSEDTVDAVEVWSGDLSKPQFGLAPARWNRLSGRDSSCGAIDTIIHNGAAVHWTSDYAALKATNVDSTTQLVEAALQSRSIRRFIYISGGVSWNNREDSRLAEDGNVSAYAKTKYLSEQMVLGVADHPLQPRGKFSVVKPALIIGSATPGVANVGDFLWRYVRSCIRIRAFPREPAGSWLPVAETGEVAAKVIDQAVADEADVFNSIDNGMLVESFWGAVQASVSFCFSSMDMAEWSNKMQESIQKEQEAHPLWPVQQFLGPLGVYHNACQQETRSIAPWRRERLQLAVTRNVQHLQQMRLLASREHDEDNFCP